MSDTKTTAVRTDIGRISRLTLANPQQRNPLSVAVMAELTGQLWDLDANDDVRAIILDAEGPAFSAGHYLPELVDRTRDDEAQIFEVCSTLMLALERISKPVIAQVQGAAFAAGCQLVASCDLAVAADSATFATPGVKIGLFCSTPMVALSRNIGQKRAMQMLMTGKPIDASTALSWGLVNDVVTGEELDASSQELAESVAASSMVPIRIGKRAFYEQRTLTTTEAYQRMSHVMADNAVTCDAQEGIGAFLDKRDPVWRDE